jgi:hypothetical protein
MGKIWEHLLCMNMGPMEQLAAITSCGSMFGLSLPLLFDTSYLLMQRVHPQELVPLMLAEVASI